MARFRDDEEDYGYGRPEEEIGYQPYFEQPAPEAPPPEADAAIEALTGGGDSLYDPGPGPALDALLGGGPDYGEPIGMPTPEWEDTDGPNTDKFNPDRLAGLPSFGESDDDGGWHTMGSGAGRNDQYGLPEEYNILDPGALGGSPNDPSQATLGPSLPDATGVPGQSKLPDPNAPPKDPKAPRITTPDDPTRGLTHEELWQQLFGVPYGQFPPGYGNPLGLPGVTGTIGGSPTPGSTPGATPGAAGAGRGAANQSTFEGFNLDKLNNPGGFTDANTAKYQFARVAQHYSPSDPQALEKIAAEMQKTNPNVKYVGQDKIDFGDGYGPIDVSRAWEPGKGGKAWVWIPPGEAGGGGQQPVLGADGKPVMGPDGKPLMKPAAGGVGGGYGGSDANGAFQSLKSSTSPNAPKEQMEAAIRAHFANVPGFSEAYKESAKINGVWYDMVLSYGSPSAQWTSGLSPKG